MNQSGGVHCASQPNVELESHWGREEERRGEERRGGREGGGLGRLNNSPKSADDFHSVEMWLSGCWAGATVVRWCLQGREIRTVYRNK